MLIGYEQWRSEGLDSLGLEIWVSNIDTGNSTLVLGKGSWRELLTTESSFQPALGTLKASVQ